MNLPRYVQKTISLSLIILVLIIPLMARQTDTGNDYLQGKADGEMDAKGNPLWLLGGALCGIFGVAGAYFIKPKPPTEPLLGKSAEYVLGYTEGYQNKARGKNAGYACGGWAIFIVIFAAAGGFDTSSSD
jgi:hypothetical protein